AARDATLGIFNRRFGVPLIDLGTVRLPRLIGQGRALDLILTGRAVSGEEALHMGLVNRLVEPGRALATATQLAHELAEFPQHGLRSDRMSVYEQWALPWEDARRNELRRGREVLASGESREGAQRFASGAGRHGSYKKKNKEATTVAAGDSEVEGVNRIFQSTTSIRDPDIPLEKTAAGSCESTLAVQERMRQQHGFVHGGVIATMADHTAGGAARS